MEIFGNKSYANIFCSSIDNLKCTPSDRQMYPWRYMYPRLGTPDLDVRFARESFNPQLKWWRRACDVARRNERRRFRIYCWSGNKSLFETIVILRSVLRAKQIKIWPSSLYRIRCCRATSNGSRNPEKPSFRCEIVLRTRWIFAWKWYDSVKEKTRSTEVQHKF